ncbi:MAG TPA: alpha/beta hydrolase [Ktedonobacterales bacterium]|jgi:pimeloyl-ACP methyl ester carboxylesterase|nr:alpha/beta hydrolase [Ktedonobacterales bacterium]
MSSASHSPHMSDSSLGNSVRLRDGRALAYLEVGAGDGIPVIHCHGNPSSRLEVLLLAEQATNLNVRLIAVDRPGIGYSDPKPGYGLLDWPDDVAEVADQLGLDRFAVSGLSGGGPFALACAYKIPERLTACGLISTVAPVAFMKQAGPGGLRAVYWLLERMPPALFRAFVRRTLSQGASASEANMEKTLTQNSAGLGSGDQQAIADPRIRQIYARTAVESYRQGKPGLEANVEEARLLATQWAFHVEDISFERILLWHGEQDRIMPVGAARRLAQALPHSAATYYPDAGHLSTAVTYAPDILQALRSTA